MQLVDPSVLKVEMVEVEESEDQMAGIIITTRHAEILVSEDELKKLLKWCKTGKEPK